LVSTLQPKSSSLLKEDWAYRKLSVTRPVWFTNQLLYWLLYCIEKKLLLSTKPYASNVGIQQSLSLSHCRHRRTEESEVYVVVKQCINSKKCGF
jgi:hypothetical protein